MNQEEIRLKETRDGTANWKMWGPYLAERAWGSVREDYSPDGEAWTSLPHDQARSRAYRWNEDGIAGICDRYQNLCFALALWNGRDPILKERMFGLTGAEANHGEDVKEYYFYLDSTPTHSYMKMLYKYPQREYPYERLIEENSRRSKLEPEYELLDTGIFDDNRYFDVFTEFAKAGPDDILIKVTVANRGPEDAHLTLLPSLWYRNTWSWDPKEVRPSLKAMKPGAGFAAVEAKQKWLGKRFFYCQGAPELLFTENDTNSRRLFDSPNATPYVKDAFHDYVIHGKKAAVNPDQIGTKMAARYELDVPAGGEVTVTLRLSDQELLEPFGPEFGRCLTTRVAEADAFYAGVIPKDLSEDARMVSRQALAGMMWSKQFYYYVVKQWLDGDPAGPAPPEERKHGRNSEWKNFHAMDVLTMPDTWEYPWFAAWDLAFHCVTIAMVDPDFAKEQLVLLTREWYMHPNGQLPAYEWNFSDVNPPVHAWAAWTVYNMEKRRTGKGDTRFLKRIFNKLLLNFTWWVHLKDQGEQNIFEGGFLGLDNIAVFDRSHELPTGGYIEQSDGTAWMGMFTLDLLAIAMELAREDVAYEDMVSKFWEHFVYIAHALNNRGVDGSSLWDEEEGFFFDLLRLPDGSTMPLRVRSMVGLTPLFAVETLDPELLDRLPEFKKRLEWFIKHQPELAQHVPTMEKGHTGDRRLLALVDEERLRKMLKIMLDPAEFLSDHGIRALSRYHKDDPYTLIVHDQAFTVDYEPAESKTGMFGGNSNWRGPIWMPVNYLLIEALHHYHSFFGDGFKVECPTGSGNQMNLREVANELSRRVSGIFLRGQDGNRPVYQGLQKFQNDPHWRDYVLFHEYFHGDTGQGLGASHQTGWTGLVAKLLEETAEPVERPYAVVLTAADPS